MNRSRRSSLSHSFLKSDPNNSLSRSLKKSDYERIAPVALYKRATVSDSLKKPMSEFPTLSLKMLVLPASREEYDDQAVLSRQNTSVWARP